MCYAVPLIFMVTNFVYKRHAEERLLTVFDVCVLLSVRPHNLRVSVGFKFLAAFGTNQGWNNECLVICRGVT
jgi:hypothetical protein